MLWRQREIRKVVTSEIRHVLSSEKDSPCDVRVRSAMLWRQGEIRKVVTSERSAKLWRQRDSSCFVVRKRFTMLWRQSKIHHGVTSERSTMLWRQPLSCQRLPDTKKIFSSNLASSKSLAKSPTELSRGLLSRYFGATLEPSPSRLSNAGRPGGLGLLLDSDLAAGWRWSGSARVSISSTMLMIERG